MKPRYMASKQGQAEKSEKEKISVIGNQKSIF